MKMIDKLAYVADELRYSYILNRTVIDAGKDLAKGSCYRCRNRFGNKLCRIEKKWSP